MQTNFKAFREPIVGIVKKYTGGVRLSDSLGGVTVYGYVDLNGQIYYLGETMAGRLMQDSRVWFSGKVGIYAIPESLPSTGNSSISTERVEEGRRLLANWHRRGDYPTDAQAGRATQRSSSRGRAVFARGTLVHEERDNSWSIWYLKPGSDRSDSGVLNCKSPEPGSGLASGYVVEFSLNEQGEVHEYWRTQLA